MVKDAKISKLDKNISHQPKGQTQLIASYSQLFSEPLFQSLCQTALVQGVDEGEFDFITTMFRMNVDQHMVHSPRMVLIICWHGNLAP